MNGLEVRGEGRTWRVVDCTYAWGVIQTLTVADETVYATRAEAITAMRALVKARAAAVYAARFPKARKAKTA